MLIKTLCAPRGQYYLYWKKKKKKNRHCIVFLILHQMLQPISAVFILDQAQKKKNITGSHTWGLVRHHAYENLSNQE